MPMPEVDRMKDVARRWIEEGWRNGGGHIVDRLHAPDFIDHDSAGRSPDNAGFQQGIVSLYEAFPDLEARVEGLFADADAATVTVRWSATGTHRGAYLGFEPTRRTIRFKGIEIIRMRDDRITERWGEWDGLDLLDQLQGGAP